MYLGGRKLLRQRVSRRRRIVVCVWGMYVCEDVASLCPEVDADARRLRTSTIDGTGADGPRSEGGRKVLRDNSRVYVRFIPFVGG